MLVVPIDGSVFSDEYWKVLNAITDGEYITGSGEASGDGGDDEMDDYAESFGIDTTEANDLDQNGGGIEEFVGSGGELQRTTNDSIGPEEGTEAIPTTTEGLWVFVETVPKKPIYRMLRPGGRIFVRLNKDERQWCLDNFPDFPECLRTLDWRDERAYLKISGERGANMRQPFVQRSWGSLTIREKGFCYERFGDLGQCLWYLAHRWPLGRAAEDIAEETVAAALVAGSGWGQTESAASEVLNVDDEATSLFDEVGEWEDEIMEDVHDMGRQSGGWWTLFSLILAGRWIYCRRWVGL